MVEHKDVIYYFSESFDTELNANNAFLFLHKCGFKSCQWDALTPFLQIPLDDRKKLLSSYEVSKNHDWVLEEMLSCWIKYHFSQPSLEELTKAVEDCGEKNVAIKMKKELQMKIEDTNIGKHFYFCVFGSYLSNS